MKLDELIEALAAEVEMAQPRLAQSLAELAMLDGEDPAFMDALEHYSGQAQRMGEAAEMVGFPGLQAVCNHVLENTLALPMLEAGERTDLIDFLAGWPPLIVEYLRHAQDATAAAGLVDHLVKAPYPLDEEQALKVMHMLGALPQQAHLAAATAAEPPRAVVATEEDVALVMPPDADPKLLEGFFHEAPEQARYLVELARNMVGGLGDSSDLVAAKRVAHTLKGSGAIIGLRGLASLGHHFEDILEHFERQGGHVAKPAADALLDAAYCLEQMVGYVAGSDEYPAQAQAVLQQVLDLANRIDRGESLESPAARAAPVAAPAAAQPAPPSVAAPGAALRITVERVDELFRLSGEVSVHSAALESRIKALTQRSRELLDQNLRVQKRLFELETLVDVRALTMMRARGRRGDDHAFDPLEMDQYSELHSTAHALMEEAADARVMALRLEEGISGLEAVHARHDRLAKDLQHLVIGTRMTAAGVLESRLQRNVRTTCQATGKLAKLVIAGADTQIDSDVLTRLTEPLLHLLRNAVDHGLETPQERLAAGKPETGRVELSFTRQGQQVVMRCADDGRGLDLAAIRRRAIERGLVTDDAALDADETARLLLLPGFTTCDAVNEVSGRGIGLDVVREWAAGMGGTVRFESVPGAGCTVELRFAASLSTIHSLIVEAGGHRFALASVSVEQAVPRGAGRFESVGEQWMYRHGKRVLPALRLDAAVGLPAADGHSIDECDAVIARVHDKLQVVAVDRLVDSRELLVKSPGRYARHLRGVVGLSILGDGGVAVNLDLAQLLGAGAQRRAVPAPQAGAAAPERARPGVLIVDDALSVRNSLMQLVQDAGFRAQSARDGMDAIETLRDFKADIVLTDLEMPNMNGIELTAHIRAREDLKGLPVIMITSRSQEKHRGMATQAGVDTYITKPYNEGDLLQTIREAITP